MAHRLTKIEAATRLDVSASTIDRMIRKGELQIEREPHGSRHRIWVVMDDDGTDNSVNSSPEASESPYDHSPDTTNNGRLDTSEVSGEVEVAVLRERVNSLEELANYHRDLLKDSEWRYQQAMEQLGASHRTMAALTKALPTAQDSDTSHRRSWWPFRKAQR